MRCNSVGVSGLFFGLFFITHNNLCVWCWGGLVMTSFGVLFHLSLGWLGPQPVNEAPTETVLNLLKLERVAYRTGITVAIGYAQIFSAIVLKLLSYFVRGKSKNENI